jgi:hypothetical protein
MQFSDRVGRIPRTARSTDQVGKIIAPSSLTLSSRGEMSRLERIAFPTLYVGESVCMVATVLTF